jgi:ferrochelatase
MELRYDAVLLIGFGGPTEPEEIRPFIERVLSGRHVAPSRVEEVARHYERVGGRSPYNDLTFRQARALTAELEDRGFALPVSVGFRHASPFLRESLERLAALGSRRAIAFILAPHRTEASWDGYRREVAAALAGLGRGLAVDYCPAWHTHPLLIAAWIKKIEAALAAVDASGELEAEVIFTAHSVPLAMAAASGYAAQVEATAARIAERLAGRDWSVAYQSRSGRPEDPWLEPDIAAAIRDSARRGKKAVVAAPIGFVSDHVEILYDLAVEARAFAEELNLRFARAACLNDEPLFIRMIADLIAAEIRR